METICSMVVSDGALDSLLISLIIQVDIIINMNYLYLNNSSQLPLPRTFVFNKRNEKIDWRRIGIRIKFFFWKI